MNMSPHSCIILVAMGICLAGCYPRADRYLDGIERPARASDAPVDIFYAGQAPTRPNKFIMLFRITANNGPDVVGKLRRECRKYGCDGAIFQNVRGAEGSTNFVGESSSKDTVEAIGIIYTDQ